MPQIWTDEYIFRLHNDADDEITRQLDLIFMRFPLEIFRGQSVYRLPDWVRRIENFTWKGKKVLPISYEEMQLLHQASSIISETVKVEAPRSDMPYFYCLYPTGVKTIRLYPTPDAYLYPPPKLEANLNCWCDSVTLDVDGSPFGETVSSAPPFYLTEDLNAMDGPQGEDFAILSVWRTPTDSLGNIDYQLPLWIGRRVKKSFVLAKAYSKEGPGQDLTAAKYYTTKFDAMIGRLKKIFEGVFVSKKYRLSGGWSEVEANMIGRRPPKPTLPANFENIRY